MEIWYKASNIFKAQYLKKYLTTSKFSDFCSKTQMGNRLENVSAISVVYRLYKESLNFNKKPFKKAKRYNTDNSQETTTNA